MRGTILFLGLVIYVIGLCSISCVAPLISRKTYLSENALMPTAALIQYNEQSWEQAILFQNRLFNTSIFKQEQIILDNDNQYLAELAGILNAEGFEASFDSVSGSVTAILRSPKGSGTESIVISTTYPSSTASGIDGLSVGVSLLKHLQKCDWLAKDIILLACNAHKHDCMRDWIKRYLDSSFHLQTGLIQAAINIQVNLSSSSNFQTLSVLLEGSNGQLPNLDLLNSIYKIVKRETSLKDENIYLSKERNNYAWLDMLADKIEPLAVRALQEFRKTFPQTSYAIHSGMSTTKTLFRFMLNQAIGVPTSDHGYFNMFHIDSVTLFVADASGKSSSSSPMFHFGRVLEGTIRSLNNLIEQLHQSFYYYLLPSPILYIPIGDYMIPFGLIMFPFLIQLLMDSLSLSNPRFNTQISKIVVLFVLFQLVGTLVFTSALMLWESIESDYQLAMLLGLELGITLPVWLQQTTPNEIRRNWTSLRTVVNLPILLFLTVGSLINISFCMITAAFLIPLLMIRWSCLTWLSKNPSWKWKHIMIIPLQLTLLLISSPFTFLGVISYLSNQSFRWSFTTIVTHYVQFGTMSLPWLCLVHLPHWTAELLITWSLLR